MAGFFSEYDKPLCYVLEKVKFSTAYCYRGNDTNKNLIILLIQIDGSSVFYKIKGNCSIQV